MAQSEIAAKIVAKELVEETMPDTIDVYVNVGFSLYPINSESVSDDTVKDGNNTDEYVGNVSLLDTMQLRAAYTKNCIAKDEEEKVIHKEFFVDCSDLLLDENGYCADAYTAYLKILEVFTMVDRYLYQFSIRREKVFVHFNVYSFENIEDLAWGFAFMADAMMSFDIDDKELEELILDDYTPHFVDYINKGWKISVEFVGLFTATRVFFLTVSKNHNIAPQASDTVSKSITTSSTKPSPKGSPSPTPSPNFPNDITSGMDDLVRKNPFYVMMNLDFGPTHYLKGHIEETMVIGDNNTVSDSTINENNLANDDIGQNNEESHPFLWLMYTGIRPMMFLTHEGLRGTGLSEVDDDIFRAVYFAEKSASRNAQGEAKFYGKRANETFVNSLRHGTKGVAGLLASATPFPRFMRRTTDFVIDVFIEWDALEIALDNYFLSAYYARKGDEARSREYATNGNKEFSNFTHSVLNVASFIPVIGTPASLIDGIYWVGQMAHAYATGDKKSGDEYRREVGWAIIGAIPFGRLVRGGSRVVKFEELATKARNAAKDVNRTQRVVTESQQALRRAENNRRLARASIDANTRNLEKNVNKLNQLREKGGTERQIRRAQESVNKSQRQLNEAQERLNQANREYNNALNVHNEKMGNLNDANQNRDWITNRANNFSNGYIDGDTAKEILDGNRKWWNYFPDYVRGEGFFRNINIRNNAADVGEKVFKSIDHTTDKWERDPKEMDAFIEKFSKNLMLYFDLTL